MKNVTLLCILLFLTGFGQAQKYHYPDAWSNDGFNLTGNLSTAVQVVHSIRTFEFNQVEVEGKMMNTINMPGVFLPNDEGMPNLPGNGRYIAIPSGAVPHLNVISQRTETFQNIDVAPSPRIPNDLQPDFPLKKNQAVYSKNAFYPETPVRISEVQHIRGVDVVILGITPFQYNPVTKELIVYRDIKVEVTFDGGNGQFGDIAYRSRWWDPIMQDNILNHASLPDVDYNKQIQTHISSKSTLDDECEYIIITPTGAEFLAWADSIRKFRTQQGILTRVFTIDQVGGNTTDAIESFINNAYYGWTIKPAACLLLGDYGSDGTKNIISYLYNDHPDGYNPYASDNKFADVDEDLMPDVVFSRIVANNETQLQVIVTKFLENERNPSTDPLVYDKPISALGWQTERWFQLCSEIVGGYFKNVMGKHPRRINAIYQGTPGSIWSSATNTNTIVSYFGPGGTAYIPATPSELGGWTGGTAAKISNAIDSGSFILVHRDHGNYTGWGEPAYSNSNITGLQNTVLPFVFSINCQTGAFHRSSECFGEKFVRHTKNGHNAGALGIVCPTETSYSFVNDTFVWGMFDNMFPDFMPDYGTTPESRGVLPAFGNAAGKYFLKQSNWPAGSSSVKPVTYKLFHMLGDAFQVIYTDMPQQLTVTHDPDIEFGTTTFSVEANMESLIALTANDEIIGTGTGVAGAPVVFQIPADLPVGTKVYITVTKQNFFRYSDVVTVTSSTLTSNFSASATRICVGSPVDFSDLSSGAPQSWQWSFNGGTPSTSADQNPTGIVYNTAGVYDVALTVRKPGFDSSFIVKPAYIQVFDLPEAMFSSETACPGEISKFNDNSNPHGATFTDWVWTFGDPNSGSQDTSRIQNPTHTYSLPGTYTVNLIVTNDIGCTDNYATDIVVKGVPAKAANPAGPGFACQGETSLNFTTAGATDAISYSWVISPDSAGTITGDGTSALLNPVPAFSGPVSITVAGVNICGKGEYSDQFMLNVLATPLAPEKPTGTDSVDVNKVAASDFTINAVIGANLYSWKLTPEGAGTISGTGLTGTVTWNAGYRGSASIVAGASNFDCPGPVSEIKGVTVYSTVGIGENNNMNFDVYPNPTTGRVSVDITMAQSESVDITVFNALGNIVFRDNNINVSGKLHRTIDLSSLPGGIYLLRVTSGTTSKSTRVVVAR